MAKIEISVDDGDRLDLKTASMLAERGFFGTFYIPSTTDLTRDEIRHIRSLGHRIGGHTVTHPVLRDLPIEAQRFEVEENKRWLEEIIGEPVGAFCYPKGKYSDETVETVRIGGFTTARTTDVLFIGEPEDPLRLKTTIHVHPSRVEYLGRDWLTIAKEWYVKAKRERKTYRLWFHSWEVEKYELWKELTELLTYIG